MRGPGAIQANHAIVVRRARVHRIDVRGDDLRARGVFVKGTPVGCGVVATDARASEELDVMLTDAAQRAVGLAASLRAGELEPSPQNCSRDGCKYPAICRSQ